MSLIEKQWRLCLSVAELIRFAEARGMRLAFAEAWRSDEQAEINALGFDGRARLVEYLRREPEFRLLADKIANNAGNGIRDSLHTARLAVDFVLRLPGSDIPTWELRDWEPLGEFWESLGDDHHWGGRFGDAPHFSIGHWGRK